MEDHIGNISIANSGDRDICVLSPLQIVFALLYALIIIMGIIGNSIIQYFFSPFFKRDQKVHNILIWYLSLFDLLSTLIIIVDFQQYVTCYANWPFGWFGCKLFFPSYQASMNLSVCLITFVAIDRHRTIVTPFKVKFQPKKAHQTVAVSVLLCFGVQWYQFEVLQTGQYRSGKKSYIQCLQQKDSYIYTIPRMLSIIVRDLGFLYIFVSTSRQIHYALKRRNLTRRNSLCTSQKKDKDKIFLTVLTMGFTFMLLVFPYDAWDCVMLTSRMLSSSHHIQVTWSLEQLDMILSLLQTSNCIVNCFIFAKIQNWFKVFLPNKNIKQIISRKCNKCRTVKKTTQRSV